MDLSLVTWEARHARIDIIIGLSYLLALWIFIMHFEVFRGRASWDYLESLIQFLIGLTHVESPRDPLAASLKSNTQVFRGLWGNQFPPQLLLRFHRTGISTSTVLSGKWWSLVHQPRQLWLPSQPLSVLFRHPVVQLLARQLWKIISYSLASASLASITHEEFTTPTPCHTGGSTWLTEAKLKMQEVFSSSFLGKAFYSINQLLEQNSKRQWVRHLMTKII